MVFMFMAAYHALSAARSVFGMLGMHRMAFGCTCKICSLLKAWDRHLK